MGLFCAQKILLWSHCLLVPIAAAALETMNYFAIGSNVLPRTMTSLRGLRPASSTAAILRDHRLAFRVAGLPLVEPSAASLEKSPGDTVHGVLYELTKDDFARLGASEGVPFVYKWEPVDVVPYEGDDRAAGAEALKNSNAEATVSAYALAATRPTSRMHVPPSSSYLGIIQEGAALWKMDRSYQLYLSQIRKAQGLVPPGGTSRLLLDAADCWNVITRR
jgi:hypothetical protein